MKEHLHREMNNELCEIAQKFHAYGCLREMINACTTKWLGKQGEWDRRAV